LRATLPLFGALFGLALILNLDLLALKLLVGDERLLTGYYQAGIILANVPYYLVTAARAPILFTQLVREQSLLRGAARLGEMIALTLLLIFPLEFALIVAPDRALGVLFPAAYAPGAATLRLLAMGNALLIVVALLSTAFQAVGRAYVLARILLLITLVEPLALAVAVPRWHGLGAASVFVGASMAALLGLRIAGLREIGTSTLLSARNWVGRYVGVVGVSAVVGRVVISRGQTADRALLLAAPVYVLMLVLMRLVPGLPRRDGILSPVPALTEDD